MSLIDSPGSLDQQLRFAIAHKRLIQVRYDGRSRLAEPHDYGIKNGSPKLLIYQVRADGGSQKKSVQGWRLLDLAKIEACRLIGDVPRQPRRLVAEAHRLGRTLHESHIKTRRW